MFSGEDYLSKLIDVFLDLKVYYHNYPPSPVNIDRMKFFIWELKFLDCFLGLQNFAFAGECGMLCVTHRMQKIWKTLQKEDADSDAAVDSEIWKTELQLRRKYGDLGAAVDSKIWNTKLKLRAKYSFPEISILSLSSNKEEELLTSKFVMEFMDSVAENLHVLVQINDPCSLLYVPAESKKEVEDVLKELKLLRFFVSFVSKKCIEPQSKHSFFTHVLIETAQIAMVTWLYLPKHGNEEHESAPTEMNVLLSDLLHVKIKPIHKIYSDVLRAFKVTNQNNHSADNLVQQQLPTVSNPCQRVGLIDQMAMLQEMLSLLRENLIHLPIPNHETHQHMDTVTIIDAGILFYSLYNVKEEKEGMMLEDVNRALGLDLPNNIQPIMVLTYLIIRKAFQSDLPKIHGLGYVDFLLNNLKEFSGRYADSLASINNQLQIIQMELESLQPFLEDVAEEKHKRLETVQDSAKQLINKAYEVEYVVDAACIRKEIPHWCLESWLLDIIEEIARIKSKVTEIQEKKMSSPVRDDVINTAIGHKPPQLAKTSRMKEEFVGLEDVRKELRDRLTKGCRELDVISIVGMPGLGKTTLAKTLYSDESVVEHFDIRVQCCVSRVYKRMDLLLALLRDAAGESPSSSSTEADVADQLRKILMVKRYLILVDDVWGASAWDDLRSCFYDAKNGSRILLTTRNLEVADHATCVSKPIHLRMFNDEESWKLLEDKVFGKECCSPPLEEIGQTIAKKCGGLPLSIVLVAGILAKMEKREESWKRVAKTLGSHIHRDSEAILEQSYQDLPYHLIPCFLYFGAFLEDRVIEASMLTRLWISEAFIKSCEGKSLEDTAEGYLENLIRRNLVMVARRADSDGKVKACHMHDVLLEFCKIRAMEENFLLCINRDQSARSSTCICSHKLHSQRRLAFDKKDDLEEWSSSCSFVGSVLFTNNRCGAAGPPSISRRVPNVKFLKVLDLGDIVIDCLPTELVYLRYFSARYNQHTVPSSIANLWNLETLILKHWIGDHLILPSTVYNMIKLRHLNVVHTFPLQEDDMETLSTTLNDLETVSRPFFCSVEDAELMLRKAPNLRELICHLKGVRRGEFPVLVLPPLLEMLHIHWSEEEHLFFYPPCISASNLKSLEICYFVLGPQHLSNIAQLQNLQVLRLIQVAFDNQRWVVRDDGFPQLKVLMLCCPLRKWIVSDDAFQNLECLFLEHCSLLEKIPSCFGDISSLKYIKLEDCNEDVLKSARDIYETQVEDYQNTDFKLFIK